MAKGKYASLRADMVKTVQLKRAVIIGPDGEHVSSWAILPGKAA